MATIGTVAHSESSESDPPKKLRRPKKGANRRRVRLWSVTLTVANVALWLKGRYKEVEEKSNEFSVSALRVLPLAKS
jgi:hypothetical protein